MSVAPTLAPPLPVERSAARRGRPALVTAAAGIAVAGLVLLTPAFLLLRATEVGWGTLRHLLFRGLVGTLLWNTIRLTAAVTVLTAVLGVGAAWFVERTRLPARRFWAVVVVLPIAVPEFVMGESWASVLPAFRGYLAAVVVMTLALYPFVYLPVAAALRGIDPAQQEIAASLGLGPVAAFFRVTLRQIRPALLGGCLLVSLYLLADYGAFAVLGFSTFTTTIFNQFHLAFNAPAGSALAMVLVVLSLLFLAGEFGVVRRNRYARLGPGAARVARRLPLGRAVAPVLAGLSALVLLAIGVPVGVLAYWMLRGTSTTLPTTSIVGPVLHTVGYALGAATLTTAMAVPVAVLAVRKRTRLGMLLDRVAHLAQGLPGIVVGLTLVYFALRFLPSVYQTSWLVVVAYAILFLPLALVGVRAAFLSSSSRTEEAARSLGARPAKVFFRVTLPAIGPGLAAAFALVFLASVTELTATLLLRPTGVETLATQFWYYTNKLAYGAAAPYAALILVVAGIPTFLLGRRLDAQSGLS